MAPFQSKINWLLKIRLHCRLIGINNIYVQANTRVTMIFYYTVSKPESLIDIIKIKISFLREGCPILLSRFHQKKGSYESLDSSNGESLLTICQVELSIGKVHLIRGT